MEAGRTRPEVRPNKPFSLETNPLYVSFPYFNSNTSLFVNTGGSIFAVLSSTYPMLRISRIEVIILPSSPANPIYNSKMFNAYIGANVIFSGVALHGRNNYRLGGSFFNSKLCVDCDLLLLPSDVQNLQVGGDFVCVCGDDYITSNGEPDPWPEFMFSIRISGEYVDI